MSAINFVHVPKTGGRHLTTTVLSYLTLAVRSNDLDPKDKIKYMHDGWPELQDEDAVILTYRYPPRHLVSYFFYFSPWLVDGNPENGKLLFLQAMSGSEGELLFNYQTKFICSLSLVSNLNFEYDIDLLDQRLSKVLMSVDGDTLSPEIVSSVYTESCNFLNIDSGTQTSIPIISVPEFAIQYSADVYALLTDNEISLLEQKSDLDMHLYRTLNNKN